MFSLNTKYTHFISFKTQLFGYSVIWLFGYSVIQLFGYSVIFKKDKKNVFYMNNSIIIEATVRTHVELLLIQTKLITSPASTFRGLTKL